MLGFPFVKIWAAAGVLLAVVLSALAGYGYGYGAGKAEATAKAAEAMDQYQKEIRAKEQEQERLLAETNKKNREQEKAYEQRIADIRAKFAQQQADAQARDERTIADLRSGNRRLRLQVASCVASRPGTIEPSPERTDGTGIAELAPETSAALWGIAADGDRAIRKLIALQAWAQSAVQLCASTQPED